ncbi:uncharacterized protein BYT42DRAFT_563254 [Radiomyces spectabilis]|uniref:uncharacterized protein n=1 Tax=Radiomyces spectabilis TaxID=64574 RepID=UPI00221EC8CB|nr:uncharacterized protein BYT42DRAFT_563254 [Radiomyces spectabilis]KAI8384667.1 hypothetical protein BYT42DRAFT_563254 [Radiomyces spectabilis]
MSTAFSDAEKDQLKATFDHFTHGHGMTADTLAEIYRKANMTVTQSEIEHQLRLADTKGRGRLDFEEFLHVMEKQREHHAEGGFQKVFNEMDSDNDGLISGEDLKRCIVAFGESVTPDEIKEMMLAADVDGDGLINYEEFLKILTPSKVNGQR